MLYGKQGAKLPAGSYISDAIEGDKVLSVQVAEQEVSKGQVEVALIPDLYGVH
ncbi:hypothetical protein NW753_014435 [Fusarium oxysporum]|nr:hypothetical protein NW753_014435 [Fusarium oxysporum]KAJ4059415.1 hypothetical protein NW763_006848 [Fusarium oxysporum]